MAKNQYARTSLTRGRSEQRMPGAPRRSRDTRPGLFARPDQSARRRAKPHRLGDRLCGPSRAVGLKLVINDQGQDCATIWPRPVQDRPEEEQGVAATGKANGDRRARRWIEPPVEGGSDLV